MKELYLLMGISGSGKSTWARDFQSKFSDSIVISRDAVRFSLVKENYCLCVLYKYIKVVYIEYITILTIK